MDLPEGCLPETDQRGIATGTGTTAYHGRSRTFWAGQTLCKIEGSARVVRRYNREPRRWLETTLIRASGRRRRRRHRQEIRYTFARRASRRRCTASGTVQSTATETEIGGNCRRRTLVTEETPTASLVPVMWSA